MQKFSKNQVNFYTVTSKDENQRIDNLLNKILKNVPKQHIFKIIRSGEVKINNKKVSINTKVLIGDIIRIPPIITYTKNTDIKSNKSPQNFFKYDILFEDPYYLIINKPTSIACHGGSGVSFGVIEQLRLQHQNTKFLELAHRLDKGTSGVLIIAKNRQALIKIQQLNFSHNIKKIYLALTFGHIAKKTQEIHAPLFKYVNTNGERRVKIDATYGQKAHSIVNLIENVKDFSLVEVEIKTGRTHQIRVHLASIGHPILLDDKYGDFELNKKLQKNGLKRIFLHALKLEFVHPITNQNLKINAPIPEELTNFLHYLKSNTSNSGIILD